jgi:hypothetical protein
VGLLERRAGPALGLQPRGVTLGPRAFRGRESAAVAEEKFGEAVAGAQEIRANVFATAQEIAGGFFLLRGNVKGGQRASTIQDRERAGVATVRFHAIAWPTGINDGALTSHGMSCAAKARCSSKPRARLRSNTGLAPGVGRAPRNGESSDYRP